MMVRVELPSGMWFSTRHRMILPSLGMLPDFTTLAASTTCLSTVKPSNCRWPTKSSLPPSTQSPSRENQPKESSEQAWNYSKTTDSRRRTRTRFVIGRPIRFICCFRASRSHWDLRSDCSSKSVLKPPIVKFICKWPNAGQHQPPTLMTRSDTQ